MKHSLAALLVSSLLLATFVQANPRKTPQRHWVRPYTRKNGSFVRGHWAGSGTPGTTSDIYPIQHRGTQQNGSSGPLYYTYPQEPTLEPSWIREQRLEKAEAEAAKRAATHSTPPKKQRNHH